MLTYAGFGVAMGNAPQAVKDSADWVAPSVNSNGVAVALEKFVLI
jgi:hydroxymethylpyrimidine pyrophosphatase-like HAD family hydrolase